MKINYGRKVHDVVDAALAVIDGTIAERDELDQKMKDGCISQKFYGESVSELQRRKDRAICDANLEIEAIRQQHEKAVSDWAVLDGSKVDRDDAELLQLCDRMNPQQYQALCDKHRENATMLGLLADYAERHADLGLTANRPIDAKTRIGNFNQFCATASRAVKDSNTLQAALFIDGRADAPGVNYAYSGGGES